MCSRNGRPNILLISSQHPPNIPYTAVQLGSLLTVCAPCVLYVWSPTAVHLLSTVRCPPNAHPALTYPNAGRARLVGVVVLVGYTIVPATLG
jgi:hypothetical protein